MVESIDYLLNNWLCETNIIKFESLTSKSAPTMGTLNTHNLMVM
jgi:hypothetical protein